MEASALKKALRREQDGTGPLSGGGKDIEALAHGRPAFVVALSLCRKLIKIGMAHRGLHGYRHTILGAQVVEHPREERIAHIRIQDYRNRLALLELHHARPIGLHPLERSWSMSALSVGFAPSAFRLIFGHAERESPMPRSSVGAGFSAERLIRVCGMDVGISAGRNLGGNGGGGLGRLGGGRFHLSRKLIIRQCDGRGEQHGGKAEKDMFHD